MQHYKAKAEDCKQIYNLVQETIRTVYRSEERRVGKECM